jgi:hypothetical protein
MWAGAGPCLRALARAGDKLKTLPRGVEGFRWGATAAAIWAYRGAGAMFTASWLGPVLGAGLAQRIWPRRLAAEVAAFDSVTVMCS